MLFDFSPTQCGWGLHDIKLEKTQLVVLSGTKIGNSVILSVKKRTNWIIHWAVPALSMLMSSTNAIGPIEKSFIRIRFSLTIRRHQTTVRVEWMWLLIAQNISNMNAQANNILRLLFTNTRFYAKLYVSHHRWKFEKKKSK